MMSLVSGEDPLLHRRIDRTELDKAALVEVVQGMLGTMLVEGGVGLAANQVGLDLRIALVKYQDLHGADLIANFSGYVARIIQHEVDHLNGITILDRNKEYERSRL